MSNCLSPVQQSRCLALPSEFEDLELPREHQKVTKEPSPIYDSIESQPYNHEFDSQIDDFIDIFTNLGPRLGLVRVEKVKKQLFFPLYESAHFHEKSEKNRKKREKTRKPEWSKKTAPPRLCRGIASKTGKISNEKIHLLKAPPRPRCETSYFRRRFEGDFPLFLLI